MPLGCWSLFMKYEVWEDTRDYKKRTTLRDDQDHKEMMKLEHSHMGVSLHVFYLFIS
jgi:hypothetical protein